ncbi:MAG TPA: VWA domain-containing protein [Solirubrobacteraceae bacterium]
MDEMLDELLAFGRALRAEGLRTGTGQLLEFCRAGALLGPPDLYWAGRATLLARREEIPVYDSVFLRFWAGRPGSVDVTTCIERMRPVADEEPGDEPERGREGAPGSPHASRFELLREKSFADLTEAELEELRTLMARLRLIAPNRRSRRRQPARRGDPDLRRTIRRSFRTGGEPLTQAWRRRRDAPRRFVLLLDVSGSMASYSRALLIFAHVALRSGTRAEAFCFGTRLTRVTAALGATDPHRALARATAEVNDWDGGTRIGESIKQFLNRFGHHGLARGAVIIICSDGLEVGAPRVLGKQMERLAHHAHAIAWLNPLAEQADYQPLAGGMQAALPHIDLLASGHNLASLESLSHALERL